MVEPEQRVVELMPLLVVARFIAAKEI